ncbi:GOLPH3/VPS74 family protein [Actinoplanes teichomyceticus]|uniref:Golgi phosphoprotein 3 GPP34 n=1 Tax=Actinoplanes teichomyceticus TaxID=1867 RepID=A0A561VMR4_ACTTI|nr:GPP34 family phosphoprotein [Actinoplanes teichomyceticus]TWG12898.1 Golgi phosphoprotein 3 GPP34 [Actinoplanes teichomyceticus]GIF13650.1 hypothetical protein Ate01nite_36820 [Actinoplanes teichomyceticus]
MRRPGYDPTLVREQFFLLAHDETRHMRPRLHLPALAAGLAGATVMDLLIAGRVAVASGAVHPDRFQRDLTGDPVTDDALALILQVVPAPPLPELIRTVAPGVYERTAAALIHKGVLVQGPPRRWRRGRGYEIADEGIVVRIRAKAGYRIAGRDAPSPGADCLCALVAALGLHRALMRGERAEVDPLLQRVVREMAESGRRARHPVGGAPAVAAAVLGVVQDLATSAMT